MSDFDVAAFVFWEVLLSGGVGPQSFCKWLSFLHFREVFGSCWVGLAYGKKNYLLTGSNFYFSFYFRSLELANFLATD